MTTTTKTTTHKFARSLALVLLAILMTVPVRAQLSGGGTADNPYLIKNADDWYKFTTNINNGTNTRSYYKLTSDITLGTEENPLTTIVGTDSKYFRGQFDGDFHTIHIYMNRTERFAALFGVVDGVTIKNLKVDGTIITNNKFAGGIVAYANNGNSRTTSIINCHSSVHIICDDIITVDPAKPFDCTHGGLVGQNEKGTLSFENCIFDGWIRDSKEVKTANKCTGFVGWVNNFVVYKNCVMAGVIDVKPNDNNLKNSMANYHRLQTSATATFNGPSYYLIDYSYPGLTIQGEAAYSEAPENAVSKRFTINKRDFYVPQATVSEEGATYYGWELKEGTDYLINKVSTTTENKLVFTGINEYSGDCSIDIAPTCQISLTPWNTTTKNGWIAISSPVDGQNFANVNHLTTVSRHNIYRFDEEKRQWQEYRNASNSFDEFENGRGYLYRTEDLSGTIGFNGTPNTGKVDCEVSYTDKGDNMKGFNLIGNPYNHVIYKGVAIPNDNLKEGYCALTPQGTWVIKNDSEAIPVGTAILVQAKASAKITMKDTDEAHSSKEVNDNIWITVRNEKFEDVVCVNFKEGCGFNKMAHYNEDAPMLYVKQNDENYASANVGDDENAVNLCFETKTMGKYTLSFKANGNYSYLHLIDRMTGEDVDMHLDDEYSFIGSGNDNKERFIVKLSYNGTETSENEIFAWQNGSDIIVNGEGELQVFDIAGRKVMAEHVNGAETISTTSVPTGVYVLRLVGDEVKTQKMIIR